MPRGRVRRLVDLELLEDLASDGLGVEELGRRMGFSVAGWVERRQKDKEVSAAIERGHVRYVPVQRKNRQCTLCSRFLPLTEFHKQSSNQLGVRSHCKRCRSKQKSKYINRVDRFWKMIAAKTIRNDNGCRIWQGNIHQGKTPIVSWLGRGVSARHQVYLLAFGDLNDGEFVFVTCGNQHCLNAYHMRKGTRADREILRANSAPTGNKHRSVASPQTLTRGEQQWNAKLTQRQVIEIRERFKVVRNKSQLARELGITRAMVRSAIDGWRHV